MRHRHGIGRVLGGEPLHRRVTDAASGLPTDEKQRFLLHVDGICNAQFTPPARHDMCRGRRCELSLETVWQSLNS